MNEHAIKTSAHTSTEHIQVRKNLNFISDSTPRFWFQNDPFKTRFFDAMQITFPDGERFFIESVRAYRDQITDEKMQHAVKDFIMQEAQHGIAHDKVNQVLRDQGMPIDKMLGRIKSVLEKGKQHLSDEQKIAMTAATEHLTALMSQVFFTNKHTFAGTDPYMRALVAWHSVEETEHRAVCFDVMRDIAQVDEKTRKAAMRHATRLLILQTTLNINDMLKADGFNALQRAQLFHKGAKWLFGKKGMLTAASQEYRDWFKPDFHPDNYPMIENYPAWLAVYNETQDPIAAGHALWEAAT